MTVTGDGTFQLETQHLPRTNKSCPNIWVLDGKGVIRYRNVRGPALAEAVNVLLVE
jgi:hypothetical protein